MLKITEDSLNKKLIEASETMPDKVALKAFRNKMQGYELWKEDSFSRVRVKPGNTAGLVTLCLAKESVSASMQKRNLCSFFFYQLISSFFHFLISSISSSCFTSRQSNCAFRTASSSLRGEWPSGLCSLRQVTEVMLGRLRSDFAWVTSEA